MIIKIICLVLVTLIQITRSDNIFNSTLVFANETFNATFSLNDAANVKANHTSNNSSILELNETSNFDQKLQSGKCLYFIIILKSQFQRYFNQISGIYN